MKNNTSILRSMKQALTMAHNTNNRRAISRDFAAGCGVPEDVYNTWVTRINSIHYHIAPWIEKFNNKDVTDEELKVIYDKIFPELKALAKVDDKPLFIRESDVAYLCGKAHTEGASANGSVDVLVGQKAFRRKVEFMFGNRLAQNEVLKEDDYDIIVKYERAVSNKEKAENRLDGYIKADGTEVEGLRTKLTKAKETLEQMKALAVEMGADKKTIKDNPIISGYVGAVDQYIADIKSAEGNLTKSEKTINELGKKYKELMGKISKIK